MSGRIDPEPGARPAATVVILRDRISAPPEMLVMERSRDMRFAQAGLAIDGEALIPFARWHPKRGEVSKAFDTRFYITRMDDDEQAASVDATENVRLFWSGALEVIAFCDRGEGRIIYPTRRNLERLAQFASFAELAAHARATPVETVTPWIEERADGRFLCIPGHLGYPVTSEALDSAFRH